LMARISSLAPPVSARPTSEVHASVRARLIFRRVRE
jgi:hypothetical protein